MPEVAIVILNWNGIEFLQRFLPGIQKHTNPELAEIWVADNGSTDDSIRYIQSEHPGVRILDLEKNHGFAAGYNLALSKINTPFYVLLNSDVEVSPAWLEPLYNHMKNEGNTGACMPKIKSFSERESFEHAGAAGGFIDKYGYPFCRGRIFNRIEKDDGQYNDPKSVFWASGACMMVRSELYKHAGGLDPFFFAHMEEIDLCWRMHNMGFQITFIPESTVFHIGGGTLPKKDRMKTYLNFRNNILLLYKNLPSGRLIPILFTRIVLDWISSIQFLIKLETGNYISVLKAHLFLVTHLGQIRKLRKNIPPEIKAEMHPEMFPKSIVFQFFIRKRTRFQELDF